MQIAEARRAQTAAAHQHCGANGNALLRCAAGGWRACQHRTQRSTAQHSTHTHAREKKEFLGGERVPPAEPHRSGERGSTTAGNSKKRTANGVHPQSQAVGRRGRIAFDTHTHTHSHSLSHSTTNLSTITRLELEYTLPTQHRLAVASVPHPPDGRQRTAHPDAISAARSSRCNVPSSQP